LWPCLSAVYAPFFFEVLQGANHGYEYLSTLGIDFRDVELCAGYAIDGVPH